MFQIDEYVIHMTGGICVVKDIAPLEISGADKNKKYYLLVPVKAQSSKVYVPVDNDSAMRHIITESEALSLIEEIPSIDEVNIDNDKLREAKYKEVIKSCDLRDIVSVIKNLQTRKAKRLEEGKKNTATDDKYSKIAEENLLSELCFVLKRERGAMRDLIFSKLSC